MFGRVDRGRRKAHPFVAWIGLALMALSLVWLQLSTPVSKSAPDIQPPAIEEPFTVVVLDPGHGGQDSGTTKAGILEKDLTLDVADRVERLLQAQGMATLLTRSDDSYVSLADRAEVANAQPNCVFISIHFDSAKPAATGVETY